MALSIPHSVNSIGCLKLVGKKRQKHFMSIICHDLEFVFGDWHLKSDKDVFLMGS